MFSVGVKLGREIGIKERVRLLRKLSKAKSKRDVLDIISLEVDLPVFSSIVDEYEFLLGFLSQVAYFTEERIRREMRPLLVALKLENVRDLEDYGLIFSKFFDNRYQVWRYRIELLPKPGSLAKKTSRHPRVKDPEKIRELLGDLKDYLALLRAVKGRRFSFFEKLS